MMVETVRQAGMVTMATPFDEVSVGKCVEFGVDIVKIASSDIKDWILLEAIAATGKPVIASAGGSSLEDLDRLVAFFERRGNAFALNHCVSLYPSEDSELDLNQIDFLKARYPGVTIGLSTHEHRDWTLSVAIAYAKGARTFERHIDIEADGIPVSPYCTRPEQADVWFKAFNTARAMCGGAADVKRKPPEKEVRYLDALVRGVYARRDLPAGHVLSADDIYLAVPLLKGQISGREFVGGERLTRPVACDGSVDLAAVDCDYGSIAALAELVAGRGLERPGEAQDQPARAVG
jgi:N-acetylneuraminate synthase